MVFFAGKGIANVKVTNYTTGKESRTDAKGRYLLYAEKGHILGYESEGMKKIMIKVGKKPFINLIMEPE